jgi:hypothetical protein
MIQMNIVRKRRKRKNKGKESCNQHPVQLSIFNDYSNFVQNYFLGKFYNFLNNACEIIAKIGGAFLQHNMGSFKS